MGWQDTFGFVVNVSQKTIMYKQTLNGICGLAEDKA
jgi:hypothetical protein